MCLLRVAHAWRYEAVETYYYGVLKFLLSSSSSWIIIYDVRGFMLGIGQFLDFAWLSRRINRWGQLGTHVVLTSSYSTACSTLRSKSSDGISGFGKLVGRD